MLATMRGLRRSMRRPNWPFTINRSCSRAHGLVACYPCNRGLRHYDISALKTHGADTALTFAPGVQLGGWVGSYNGTTSKVTITPNALALPKTLAVWAFPAVAMGSSGGAAIETDTGTIQLVANNNGGTFWGVNQTGGLDWDSTFTVVLGAWQRVVLIIDGANMSFYVNGRAAGAPASTLVPTSGIGKIGTSADSQFFRGYLSDVQAWSRALTAAEIAADYAPATRWALYDRPRRRVWVSSGSPPPPTAAGPYYYLQNVAQTGPGGGF